MAQSLLFFQKFRHARVVAFIGMTLLLCLGPNAGLSATEPTSGEPDWSAIAENWITLTKVCETDPKALKDHSPSCSYIWDHFDPTDRQLTLMRSTGLIVVKPSSPTEEFCTGALLSDHYVLTAYHCVKNGGPYRFELGHYSELAADILKLDLDASSIESHPSDDFAILSIAAKDVEALRKRLTDFSCVRGNGEFFCPLDLTHAQDPKGNKALITASFGGYESAHPRPLLASQGGSCELSGAVMDESTPGVTPHFHHHCWVMQASSGSAMLIGSNFVGIHRSGGEPDESSLSYKAPDAVVATAAIAHSDILKKIQSDQVKVAQRGDDRPIEGSAPLAERTATSEAVLSAALRNPPRAMVNIDLRRLERISPIRGRGDLVAADHGQGRSTSSQNVVQPTDIEIVEALGKWPILKPHRLESTGTYSESTRGQPPRIRLVGGISRIESPQIDPAHPLRQYISNYETESYTAWVQGGSVYWSYDADSGASLFAGLLSLHSEHRHRTYLLGGVPRANVDINHPRKLSDLILQDQRIRGIDASQEFAMKLVGLATPSGLKFPQDKDGEFAIDATSICYLDLTQCARPASKDPRMQMANMLCGSQSPDGHTWCKGRLDQTVVKFIGSDADGDALWFSVLYPDSSHDQAVVREMAFSISNGAWVREFESLCDKKLRVQRTYDAAVTKLDGKDFSILLKHVPQAVRCSLK